VTWTKKKGHETEWNVDYVLLSVTVIIRPSSDIFIFHNSLNVVKWTHANSRTVHNILLEESRTALKYSSVLVKHNKTASVRTEHNRTYIYIDTSLYAPIYHVVFWTCKRNSEQVPNETVCTNLCNIGFG